MVDCADEQGSLYIGRSVGVKSLKLGDDIGGIALGRKGVYFARYKLHVAFKAFLKSVVYAECTVYVVCVGPGASAGNEGRRKIHGRVGAVGQKAVERLPYIYDIVDAAGAFGYRCENRRIVFVRRIGKPASFKVAVCFFHCQRVAGTVGKLHFSQRARDKGIFRVKSGRTAQKHEVIVISGFCIGVRSFKKQIFSLASVGICHSCRFGCEREQCTGGYEYSQNI